MAKRKAKVMVATLSLFLSLSALVLGVYSVASQREASITSTISFTATEVRVGYKLESSGAYGSGAPTYTTVPNGSGIAEYGNTAINLTIPKVDLNTGNNKFSYRFTLTSLDQVKTIYGSLDYTNITHAAFKRTIIATVDGTPFTGVWFDLPATKAVVITYVFEIDSAYAGLTENFNVGSSYQLNLDAHEIPATFSNASPAAIAYAANYNRIPSSWAVAVDNTVANNTANIKDIIIDGTTYHLRISDLQNGRYDKVNGGKSNMVLEFVEIVELREWDTSYSNVYAISTLRAYLNNDFFAKLPAEWQKAIPEVKVPTATSGTDGTIQYLPEKVFNPSITELGASGNVFGNLIVVDGAKFDYYPFTNDANSLRIKRYNNSADFFWPRTPTMNTNNSPWAITYDGGFVSGIGSVATFGTSPCFAL